MRVWRVNERDWVAGPTLLSALRGACREGGYSWQEMLDRDYFGEVPATEWGQIGCYDADKPDDYKWTLAGAVAEMKNPGIIMSTEY